MSADAYVSSTWLDFARMEKAVRMLIPDGRKTSHDQRCAPRRQRKSWNTREPSSGKNKNARRNGKGNGEARGGGVVVSAVGASVGEAGGNWTLIGLFLWATLHGMECTPARGLVLRFCWASRYPNLDLTTQINMFNILCSALTRIDTPPLTYSRCRTVVLGHQYPL